MLQHTTKGIPVRQIEAFKFVRVLPVWHVSSLMSHVSVLQETIEIIWAMLPLANFRVVGHGLLN